MILLIFGLLMVAGAVMIQFLMGGGAFYTLMQGLNTTIVGLNNTALNTQWSKHYGFMTGVYWVIPLIMVGGIILIIFALTQRREYYTSGVVG